MTVFFCFVAFSMLSTFSVVGLHCLWGEVSSDYPRYSVCASGCCCFFFLLANFRMFPFIFDLYWFDYDVPRCGFLCVYLVGIH